MGRCPRRANAQGCRGFKASNYETGVLRSQEGLGTGVMGAGIGCLSLITANLPGAGGGRATVMIVGLYG
jgi:hypothetical protein